MVITLIRGNRLETLADELARRLQSDPRPRALRPEIVAVQSLGMRAWLGRHLAGRLGVFAGVRTPFPRDLVHELMAAATGKPAAAPSAFRPEVMALAIAGILPGLLAEPRFAPLAGYLEDDDRGVKLHQLSQVVAKTFDEYLVYRPEMILEWQEHPPADSWQAALWNALRSRAGFDGAHLAEIARNLLEREPDPGRDSAPLPDRVSLFGVTTLPPLYVRLLAALPKRCEVRWYLPAPTPEYFADPARDDEAPDLPGEPVHPLLVSLGRLGRDTQRILLEAGGDNVQEIDLFDEPDGKSALCALQLGIHRARAQPPPPADGTIEIHSCFGPAREAEVLKDRLLALFDDPGLDLRPEDVVVMTPDVDGYAPYIEAAFSRGAGAGASIPLTVSDLGIRRESPAVEAFVSLLGLVRGRAPLSGVVDFLALDAVLARLKLSAADVEAIHGMLEAAKVRWGIDLEHRRAAGQPPIAANTWRAGLDRLLLGRAIAQGERALFHEVAPVDTAGAEAAAVLQALAVFCERLFRALGSLDGHNDPRTWQALLTAAFEDLIEPEGKEERGTPSVLDLLANLARDAEAARFDGELDFEVVRDILLDAIEGLPGERRFLSGGAQLCQLKPMRGIPARVLVLAGMNDGAFPRSRTAPGFDLICEHPRPGDRSIRDDDRYLFLEALLAARQRLIITYSGRDGCTGDHKNPSVLVTELLEHIDGGAVLEHPRHPFDPRYFEPGANAVARGPAPPGLFTYDAGQLAAARAMAGQRGAASPFLPGPLPLPARGDEEGDAVLRLEELVRFFRSPPEYFLASRLGLTSPPAPGAIDDREPSSVEPLQRYELGDIALGWLLGGRPEEGLDEYLSALFVLPHGVAGRLELERIRAEVEPVLAASGPLVARAPIAPFEFAIALDPRKIPLRLAGRVDDLRDGGRVRCRFSRLRRRTALESWIEHLAMCAAAPPGYPRRGVVVGRPEKGGGFGMLELEPVAADSARERLADLADLFLLGLGEPLRFDPHVSWDYEETLRRTGEAAPALAAARKAWVVDERSFLARLFPDCDPVGGEPFTPGASFAELARRVLGPLLDHLEGADR